MTKSAKIPELLFREFADAHGQAAGCPSWYRLDRWRCGDLPEATSAVIEAHVEVCVDCLRRLSKEAEEFDRIPGGSARLVQSIRGATKVRKGGSIAGYAWAGAIAAAAILALWWPRSFETADPGAARVNTYANARDARVRSKGISNLRLTAYREHHGTVERLQDRATVMPGDRLRFEIELPEPAAIMIVGEEADGSLFSYYPLGGDRAQYHKAGKSLLGTTAELDASLGQEKILLVGCPEVFGLHIVRAGLPENCSSRILQLLKVPR